MMMKTPKKEEDKKRTASSGMGGVDDDRKVKKVNKSTRLSSTHISVTVWSQVNTEINIKIKRNAQLHKLMDAYCEKQHIKKDTCRFFVDGQHVKGSETADQLGLEEGSILDAMLFQMGAGEI